MLPSASVIPTERKTLETLRTHDTYSMLSVPSILEDILNSTEPDGLALLKTLNFVAIGGAPMKEAVAERLISQGVKLLNHWGEGSLYLHTHHSDLAEKGRLRSALFRS